MLNNSLYNDENNNMKNILFFMAYFFLLVATFLRNSMIGFSWSSTLYMAVYFTSCVPLAIKVIFFDRLNLKRIFIYLGLLFVIMFSFFFSKDPEMLALFALIIGATDIKFKNIIKVYFTIISCLLFVVTILATRGVIDNLSYLKRDKIRYAFGTSYPTVFASFILYLILAYIYIRNKKITYFEIMLGFILSWVVYIYTDARSVFISLLLILSLVSILKLFKSFDTQPNNIFIFLLACAPIILTITSIYLAYNFNTFSKFYVGLNELLSRRLSLGHTAFEFYKVNLFGQSILSNGLGGGQSYLVGSDYFYLDALAMDLLFGNGILITILFCIAMVYMVIRVRNSSLIISMIILVIFIYDLTDNKSIRIAFNPFILMIFSNGRL